MGRPGFEPGTHGLKEDRCIALSALPARMSREYARKAHTAQRVRRYSFHETFHEVRASSRGSGLNVTGEWPSGDREATDVRPTVTIAIRAYLSDWRSYGMGSGVAVAPLPGAVPRP